MKVFLYEKKKPLTYTLIQNLIYYKFFQDTKHSQIPQKLLRFLQNDLVNIGQILD